MVSSCSPGWLETCYTYICLCSLSVGVEGVNHHGTTSFQSQKVLMSKFCSSGGVDQQPQHSAVRGTVYQNSRLQSVSAPEQRMGMNRGRKLNF